MSDLISRLSEWIIPAMMFLICGIGWLRRVKVYEAFTEGAAEGFQTAIRIMPYLVAMLVSINIFRVSGAMDFCIQSMQSILVQCGIPSELVPLAVMRPLSGTGSLGLVTEIYTTYGPDSMVGRIASTVLGSTDTTFYILTVYFGAVGIVNPRYAIGVGLLGDIVGFCASVYICQLFFK